MQDTDKITTTKKVKVIGEQEYINAATGEMETFLVTDVEDRDFNFTKVWLKSFLGTLDLIGNAKTTVAYWIIDNITKDNLLPYTFRQIASSVGVSLDTVSKTMSVLLEANFLKRINAGCYMVNPDVIFRGQRNARLNALTTFHDTEEREEISLEKQLKNILDTINRLTARANDLNVQIQQNRSSESQKTA